MCRLASLLQSGLGSTLIAATDFSQNKLLAMGDKYWRYVYSHVEKDGTCIYISGEKN